MTDQLVEPPVSVETAEAIESLIAALRGPGPFGLHEVARRSGGLPVYSDIGGTLFVTPQGEISFSADNGETVPEVEGDVRLRLLARVAGVEKYPQLRGLCLLDPLRRVTASHASRPDARRHRHVPLDLLSSDRFDDGLVQLHYRVKKGHS